MLEIDFRNIGSIAILDLSGSIDIDASILIEQVGWCLESGYIDIICNFENINLVDYAGLSVLSIAYKNTINHKGRMKFIRVPSHIRKTFCLVYLDRVFDLYEDEDAALRSLREDRVIEELKKKQLRRRFKRLDLDIDVEFRDKRKEEKFYHGKILNISAVGMLIFSEKSYPIGEILETKLKLAPRPGTLDLDARVVWLVQKELQPQIYPAMGLEFYNLDNPTQRKIIEFVERNLPLGTQSECL